jgi:hypothetical protein
LPMVCPTGFEGGTVDNSYISIVGRPIKLW